MYFITLANPTIKISYVGYHKAQYWAHYYLLYVNNILTNTSNVLEFVLFAVDTTITYSHSDVITKFDMIKRELQKVTIELV